MTADDKAAVRNPAGTGGASSLSDLKRLGKYQIDKKIGAGGMGAVFLARDTELKRIVALKVLPRDKAENPILVRRFRAEAQAAAQLRHPNIVAVYDSGEADGYLYIAMEYVEGRDLFEMVSRRGVVPVRRSIEVIKQVAAALQHAYEQNIVHRDIKPSNLLIRRDGTVKLTDLGLARSIDDTLETNITRAGTTVGTVDYMAPEQARNSKLADIRSDLYSLGCTWYQMLTGSPPYPDGSVTNKLQAHAIKPIPDPRDKNPQIPEGLTAVLGRLMAKKPEDRYQTPAELLDELAHATLTDAAISREIFADSDSEISTSLATAAEEGYSDDGYFELDDVREVSATPIEVPTPDPSTTSGRRKPAPKPAKEPTETPFAYYKSKSPPGSTATDVNQVEPEASPQKTKQRSNGADAAAQASPASYKSKPRPIKTEPNEPETADNLRQPSRATTDDHDEPDAPDKKPKPRSNKPTPVENTASKSKPPAAKPTETKQSKPKEPSQKPLPPKRQPVEDAGDAKPLVNKDLLRNLTAIAALVLVIVGVGWMISQYGSSLDVQKSFAPPPDSGTNDPAANMAPAVASNQNDPAANEAPSVTVANNAAGSARPEAAVSGLDLDKVPDWANKPAETTSLPTLTVSAATKSATNFATLQEALQATTTAGALIKLQGAGPFPLPLAEIAQRKRIVITGDSPQDRPVIALKPAEGQTTAGLKFSDTVVDLRGIHFSMDRQVVTGAVKVVDVVDGQLFVQDCSFTSTNTSPEPAVAMLVSSTIDSGSIPRIEPQLLIDRVWVRGEGLTAASVRRAHIDAVVRDSLMVTGSAANFEVTGHVAAGVSEVPLNRPRRILRIQRCTLSAMNKIFDLSVDDSGKPPLTAIALRDTICAAQGIVPNSAIVFASRWPSVRSTDGWLTKLTWSSSSTLYLGFEQLVDLGGSFKVADATTWQRVWNSRTDPRQFQKLSFPESAGDDLSNALPQEYDSSGLSFREVKATDGGMPGCTISKLPVPDAVSHQRAVAFTSRPTLPSAALRTTDPAQVRKVDLKKDDLGFIINRGDWASGTLFEASGGGLVYMSPANIEGKSLRIVFKQTDGANLRVLPQPAKGAESKGPAAALFSIRGGTLELTNAVIEGSSNTKIGTPEWLVQASDATVILNGCRLMSPEAEGTKQVGLVRWVTTAANKPAAEVPALVIRDTYLAGSGCGIRAECGAGPVILRNSVLAVRGDAIDLRPARAGNALLSNLDAEHVTISATGAAIRFQAAPGPDAVTSPVRVFLEKCVFAPPLAFKANESANATMLHCVGPVVEQHQLEWWGGSNGVSKRVVHLIRRDGDSDVPVDDKTGLTAWRKVWEKGSSIRLLTGDKGIYLTGELPVKWRDLKPTSFELHKNSQGATWAEGGRHIGANTSGVEDASIAKRSGDSPNVKPAPNVSTKKNVGF